MAEIVFHFVFFSAGDWGMAAGGRDDVSEVLGVLRRNGADGSVDKECLKSLVESCDDEDRVEFVISQLEEILGRKLTIRDSSDRLAEHSDNACGSLNIPRLPGPGAQVQITRRPWPATTWPDLWRCCPMSTSSSQFTKRARQHCGRPTISTVSCAIAFQNPLTCARRILLN